MRSRWRRLALATNLRSNSAADRYSVPFLIYAGAATHSLSIGRNSNVGIGTLGQPQANLHVAAGFPTIRLDVITAGQRFQYFDMTASPASFSLVDGTHNKVPFVVESRAPDDSLHVDDAGNVGLGTDQPNMIGNTPAIGPFLNVRSKTGTARTVIQGTGSAELNLLHNNAVANRRNFRISSSGGFASFNVIADDLKSFVVHNALNINMSNGMVGLRVANPTRPLEIANGAFCSIGGVWTNASSRELKEDIHPLTTEQARLAVKNLQPVDYRYKNEPEERYVGFIAEDVPDLVATNDRKSLGAMDIVAVLTKVVQEQDRQLQTQETQLLEERRRNDVQQTMIKQQSDLLARLSERLNVFESQMRDRKGRE